MDVHAHRVRTQAQRLVDTRDEVLRVRIGGVPGTHAQMNDQRHPRKDVRRDAARRTLVEHDSVRAVVRESSDQWTDATTSDDRPVGDGMIHGDNKQAVVRVSVETTQPQVPAVHRVTIAAMSQSDGLFVESLMAAIAQGDEAAKGRVRAFLEGRAAKVSKS